MRIMPVEVCGRFYLNEKILEEAFKAHRFRLHSTYGKRVIDRNDPDYKWMWELIQGHARGKKKTTGAVTFRFRADGAIYLVAASGEPLKVVGRSSDWVYVGIHGLVNNRFRQNDVVPYRQKVFKVMRDLVADQVREFRVSSAAQGLGKELHVGHGADGSDPFGAMVVKFLISHGLPARVEDIEIERVALNSGDYKLSMGDEMEGKWKAFHRKEAKLWMQDARANLSDNFNNKRKLWELEEKTVK